MTKPRHSFRLISALAAFTALLLPAAARADDPPPPATTDASVTTSGGGSSTRSMGRSGGPFGAAGQLVYSIVSPDEFPFYLTKTGDGDWNYAIRPAADYFIVRNVSVGGIVSLAGGGGSADIRIGARAGYNLAISDLVSFWPRVGISYRHYNPNMGDSSNSTQLDVTAPFLFHFVPHFFLGVGPMFYLPLSGGGDATFGLTAIVGGWF